MNTTGYTCKEMVSFATSSIIFALLGIRVLALWDRIFRPLQEMKARLTMKAPGSCDTKAEFD
jgi:hypothetical protein